MITGRLTIAGQMSTIYRQILIKHTFEEKYIITWPAKLSSYRSAMVINYVTCLVTKILLYV